MTNGPGEKWVRLPIATPTEIFVARRIKKFFSGDLENPVLTYPPFPGKYIPINDSQNELEVKTI